MFVRCGWRDGEVVFVGDANLGGLVLAGGDEVGAVGGPLEIGDEHVGVVDEDIVNEFASLGG